MFAMAKARHAEQLDGVACASGGYQIRQDFTNDGCEFEAMTRKARRDGQRGASCLLQVHHEVAIGCKSVKTHLSVSDFT